MSGRKESKVAWRTKEISSTVEVLETVGLVFAMFDVIFSSTKGEVNEELK
jgi:hypothetical protein